MSQLERLERQEATIRQQKILAVLEDEFVAKKSAGTLTRDDKLVLRAARQDYRDNHRKPAENGAQPATIGVTAEVEEA